MARYVAWQAWQRVVRRPWTVALTPGRRIVCHPHSSTAAAVLYYGLPDPMEMRFLLDYLDDGDVFVDVGANTGVYTVLATAVPDVRVVAVEPSTAAFARLPENVEATTWRTGWPPGAWPPGEARARHACPPGQDAMNAIVDGPGPSEPVEVATVDSLAAAHGEGPVAAMKVDVEGMELEVLAGATRTIEADHPVLVVEVNDPQRLGAFATRHGFTCVRYDASRRLLETESIESCEGRNALLVAGVDDAVARLRRRR